MTMMMTDAPADGEGMEEGPNFQELPSLALSHICQHLDLCATLSLSQSSKTTLSEVGKHFLSLDRLTFPERAGDVSDVTVSTLLRICPNLSYIDISKCKFLDGKTIVELVQKYAPRLRVLHTQYDVWNHKPTLETRIHALRLLENIPHLLENISLCVTDIHTFLKQLPECINMRFLTIWRTHLLPNILTPSFSLPNINVLKFFSVDFEHNAMQTILSSATNLRALKLRDCGYDDANELASLCNKKLTKLEVMHSPIGACLASLDTSSLIKFGIDWCPAVVKDTGCDILTRMLAGATKLQSLKLSSGSINRSTISSLQAANPISRSLIKLQINMVSTCAVQDAIIGDADALRLFSIFPTTLQHLKLSHFPYTRSIPVNLFPHIQVLELRNVNMPLELIELNLSHLMYLRRLRLSEMSSSVALNVCSQSIEWMSLEDSSLPSVNFANCPHLEYIRLQDLFTLDQFRIDKSCNFLHKLVVNRCADLHSFLLSPEFFAIKTQLPDLNTIKIVDCNFCYNDVRSFVHYIRHQLLCALVDFNEAGEVEHSRVKKIESQITAACGKLCQKGIDPGSPRHLSDIAVEPSVRLVTNFPFYLWLKILSDFCQNDATVSSKMRNWLFLTFRIHDYGY